MWSLWSFGGVFADGGEKPGFIAQTWAEGDEIKLRYDVGDGELRWWQNGVEGRAVSVLHHRNSDVSTAPPDRLYFAVAAGHGGGCVSILGQTQDQIG